VRKVHQVGIGRAKVLGTVLAVALLAGACGDDDDSSSDTVPIAARLDVAGASDTASQIVAEIYSQALENSGLRVGRKAAMSRTDALADLGANTLQVYPDFLHSLLTELASADGGTVPSGQETTDVQIATVNEILDDTISVGDPSPADNGQIIACSATAVDEHEPLTTLTELFDKAAEVTLGGPADFETAAPWGLAGFAADDVEFEEYVPLEDDAIGAAISDGSIDCAVLPGLSSTIVEEALIVLGDESTLAPEDVLVPLVATPALTPDVTALLSQVDTLLTTEVLRALVVKVEVGGEAVEQVAKNFIASQASSSS